MPQPLSHYPTIMRACELLVCDQIPAQMDRQAFLIKLEETTWEEAECAAVETDLAALSTADLEEVIWGEESAALALITLPVHAFLNRLCEALGLIEL
jgi:hypothetical protein